VLMLTRLVIGVLMLVLSGCQPEGTSAGPTSTAPSPADPQQAAAPPAPTPEGAPPPPTPVPPELTDHDKVEKMWIYLLGQSWDQQRQQDHEKLEQIWAFLNTPKASPAKPKAKAAH
jgi:hypothetical protein